MKKELKRRDGERIHQWIDRLSEALSLTPEQEEAMRDVAIASYIRGSDDAIELEHKRNFFNQHLNKLSQWNN